VSTNPNDDIIITTSAIELSRSRGWTVFVLRLLVGGVLAYAGLSKLPAAWSFAETLANYRLLPAQGNQIFAVVLPWCEVLTAIMLICGAWTRAAALASSLLFTAFGAAVISALARGLDIDCGCFGTDNAARLGIQTLAIDLVCLGLSLALVKMAPRE
jgi:uncharacterized membrane protein YphA (DoxX/SURF4 family)